MRTGLGGERPWLLAAALALAMGILLLLPARFSAGPSWVVPAVEVLLLAAIFVADGRLGDRRPAVIRGAVVCAGTHPGRGRRVRHRPPVADLVEGGPVTNSAASLLRVGFGVWVYTMLGLVVARAVNILK